MLSELDGDYDHYDDDDDVDGSGYGAVNVVVVVDDRVLYVYASAGTYAFACCQLMYPWS